MANNVISYSSFSVVNRDIVTTFYITCNYFIWGILLYGEKGFVKAEDYKLDL